MIKQETCTGVTDRKMDEDYSWEQKQLPVHHQSPPKQGLQFRQAGETGAHWHSLQLLSGRGEGPFPGTSAALSLNETAQPVCQSFHSPYYCYKLGGRGLVSLTIFWGLVEPLRCLLSG